MTGSTSLPPHLEHFVREQIAIGRYRSDGDVIRAALQLLEASSCETKSSGPRLKETAASPTGQATPPATTERWIAPEEWLAGTSEKDVTTIPDRRSPRGLLSDLLSGVSFDDLKDARREVWAGLRHGEV